MPNLDMSYLEVAINSMAQHASPIGIGQTECLRIQLITASACHDHFTLDFAIVGDLLEIIHA